MFPVPLSAQHYFDNEWFGGASSGNPIGNQSFGDALGGSSIGNQSFGVSNQVRFGNQTFGALSSDGGLFGNQTFGAIDINFSNLFNNQYFGEENTPTGSGLTILLIAGAGYAFYKKQRTNNKPNNKQKTLEK